MPILGVTAAFDDDVGVVLEQADDLLAGGNGFAAKDPTLGLGDDPLDQGAIVGEGCSPDLDHRAQHQLEPRRRFVEIGHHRPRDLDQLAVVLNPLGPPAGELDRVGPSLGRAPPIAPGDLGAARQGLGGLQHPRHDPNRVP